MRIKMTAIVFLLAAFMFTPALAGEKETASRAAPEKAAIKTIFSYSKELGLSDKQIARMKGALEDFQRCLNDKGKEIKELNVKLKTMIKEKADLKSIKETLQQIAAAQLDVSYADIETSRRVEEALTPAQLKKWNSMQDAYRKEEAQARQLQQLQQGQKGKP